TAPTVARARRPGDTFEEFDHLQLGLREEAGVLRRHVLAQRTLALAVFPARAGADEAPRARVRRRAQERLMLRDILRVAFGRIVRQSLPCQIYAGFGFESGQSRLPRRGVVEVVALRAGDRQNLVIRQQRQKALTEETAAAGEHNAHGS